MESPPDVHEDSDDESRKHLRRLIEACQRTEDPITFMIHRMKRLYNPVRALSPDDQSTFIVRAIIMSELDNGVSHQMFFTDPMFLKRYGMLTRDFETYRLLNPHFLHDEKKEEKKDEKEGEKKDDEEEKKEDEKKDEEEKEEDEKKDERQINMERAQRLLKNPVMFYCGQILIGSQGVSVQFLRDYRDKVLRPEYDLLSYALVKAWIFLIDYYLYDKNAIMFCGKNRNMGHLGEIAYIFNYVLRRMFKRAYFNAGGFEQMKDMPSFPEPSYPTSCAFNNMTPLERKLDQICTRRDILESYHEFRFPDSYPMNEGDYWRDYDSDSDDDDVPSISKEEKEPVREAAEFVELKNLPMVYCSSEEFEQAVESAYNITRISRDIKVFGGTREYYDPKYADNWSPSDFIVRTITGALFVFTIEGLQRYIKS